MSPLTELGQLNRRDFLKLLGASAALASFSSCRNKLPAEAIFPYSPARENEIAGEPHFYATTFAAPGFVQGILVESNNGRPTKIEGNPTHPTSLGATSLFAQASILELYSPFRLKSSESPTGKVTLEVARSSLLSSINVPLQTQGRGLGLVFGDLISPTLQSQIEGLKKKYPQMRLYNTDLELKLNQRIAFGSDDDWGMIPAFDRAKLVISIDCDFLGLESNGTAWPMSYMNARRISAGRLFVFEPALSITGTKADTRVALSTSELINLVYAIESELEGRNSRNQLARDVAHDLAKHKNESVFLAGQYSDPAIHAAVQRINETIGAFGRTIHARLRRNLTALGVRELTSDLLSERTTHLIVLGENPIYTASGDLKLKDGFMKLAFSFHLTSMPNETSAAVQWRVPMSHYLESWSDAIAPDNTESIVQPALMPIHKSITAHELLDWLNGQQRSSYEIVRDYWSSRFKQSEFEGAWQQALEAGLWATNGKKPESSALPAPKAKNTMERENETEIEIVFRPDSTVFDGRFSENPWLQELPKPPIQLCWDNAVEISEKLANDLRIQTGDLVKLTTSTGTIEAAALIVPGTADKTLKLSLGYGRSTSGPVAQGAGFNANLLRSSSTPWRMKLSSLKKTGKRYELALAQGHHDMGRRDLIQTGIPSTGKAVGLGKLGPAIPQSMENKTDQWAMTIDLDSCIGCSACVVACQAENNIPVVGKRMVLAGREMHWIRIDRYSSDSPRDVVPHPIPITCMHCETAPCEVVCPVAATSHSSDGLNQMVYNRCVGTRYCSNNCPYKVRRFNFFAFSENSEGSLADQRNPQVTVRSRGVMEKCTYCVQRIERARIRASKEKRDIRDGEVRTACQQACPTRAITFGNLRDTSSAVTRTRASERNYGLLTELGTRPRTTYLARLKSVTESPGEST